VSKSKSWPISIVDIVYDHVRLTCPLAGRNGSLLRLKHMSSGRSTSLSWHIVHTFPSCLLTSQNESSHDASQMPNIHTKYFDTHKLE
jgi:hypothetical protein